MFGTRASDLRRLEADERRGATGRACAREAAPSEGITVSIYEYIQKWHPEVATMFPGEIPTELLNPLPPPNQSS